ncbi:hypothetical protein [Achromobacter insolitus]|uniref:hypothetical protein n=1 Tax=Achromobacter insolitus TaxID=217204 RepID=UPI0013E3E25C|nr:hypothetical protein [Achromobacter insolitus]NGT16694.1 hypothetical protein [Achromobacter insolitus]
MTRWALAYEQHPFKNSWTALRKDVDALEVDDKTVVTTVEEVARLQKVIAFINKIIVNADMDLMPQSIWQNGHSQAEACMQQVRAYSSSRNSANLVKANEHADNLLTYVRPYMVPPADALEAYGAAVSKFTDLVSNYVVAFQTDASKAQLQVKSIVEAITKQKSLIDEVEVRIKKFDAYLFEGVDDREPAERYLKEQISEVEANHDAVLALFNRLLVGPESLSVEIEKCNEKMKVLHESLESMEAAATSDHRELKQFYDRIFGQVSEEKNVREGGLKQELDSRFKQLDAYEAEQSTRHNALFLKIDSLLPGATSAGLASAYKALKDKFDSPIKNYSRAFYGSLLLLLLGGLVVVLDSFTFYPFQLNFLQARSWEEMLRALLTRIPIVLPVIWLAIFSATRRSQYERLQQEYAHKEALAASYESYKKQLQDLKIDADAMQKELIGRAIEAISYNASVTLDGNHAEKSPLAQLLEKLSVDEIKKLIEMARMR